MARITIEMTGAKRKLSQAAIGRGRYAMANQAITDMNQFVPMNEGILRMEAHISSDGSSIHYTSPYAAAQFYGFVKGGRIYNYTTPGTSRRWDLRGKIRYMDNWKKAFVKGADL